MSAGIGIDLVGFDEVAESVARYGQRYIGRVYTDAERRECGSDVRCLALRFAAKEAAMKALGLKDEAVPWRSIGVHIDGKGRPSLELSGAAAELARRGGIRRLSLSLACERSVAAAVVRTD
jgi:holo-[acyl-carrier protein] synthase